MFYDFSFIKTNFMFVIIMNKVVSRNTTFEKYGFLLFEYHIKNQETNKNIINGIKDHVVQSESKQMN